MDQILVPFSICFARALGLVAFLPFEIVSMGILPRFVLAILLACCGIGFVESVSTPILAGYIVEFLLGFLIALPVILLIQAADLWGDLFESLRGQTAGSIADPLFQGETSHLALFSKNLMWVGLLAIGILETLVIQYVRSFQISGLQQEFWEKALKIFCSIMSTSMSLVLPLAFLFLIVEIAAMFAAKLLPGVSLNLENFVAKMLIGFLGLLWILGIEPLSSLKILVTQLILF